MECHFKLDAGFLEEVAYFPRQVLQLNFQVRIMSWIFKLDFRVRISGSIFHLHSRVRIFKSERNENTKSTKTSRLLHLPYYTFHLPYYALWLAYFALRLNTTHSNLPTINISLLSKIQLKTLTQNPNFDHFANILCSQMQFSRHIVLQAKEELFWHVIIVC